MKIASTIARYLMGLIFLVFGLNGFFHFIPMPPPTGIAAQWTEAMAASNYMVPVFLLQVVGGALLLANRYVPLALTILGPILVNILIFHVTMAPSGLPLALIVTILWFLVFARIRNAFSGIFLPKVDA
jgi:putative oxidoreductase